MSRATLVRAAAALVAVAALVVLVAAVEPRAIAREVGRLGWGGLLLFLLPSVGIQAFDALGWRLCFSRAPGVSFARLAAIRLAGEVVNNTLPVGQVGGEPVKVLLLRRHGVPGDEATASVVVAKLEIALAQLVFVLCGVAAALLAHGAAGSSSGVALGAAVTGGLGLLGVGAAVGVLRLGPGRLARRLVAVTGLGRRAFVRHRRALAGLDDALDRVYARGPVRRVRSIGAFLAGWLLETLEVAVFSAALGLPLGALEVLAIASLMTVARVAGSFSPASLGVQEGGAVLLFVAFGQGEALGLAYAVVRRARDLPWLLVGAGTLGSYGLLRARPA